MTIAAVLLATVNVLLLLRCRRRLRGLTLSATWWWALLAVVSVAAVEAAGLFRSTEETASFAALRFAAAMTMLCPAVSLMGAKRPQDQAWNFIVLSLWAILALPAAENFFLNAGQALEIGGARGWFLWMLIAVGGLNLLATRYWLCSLLIAAGQIVLLGDSLPLVLFEAGASGSLVCQTLIALALLWAMWQSRRRSRAPNPLDRLWLDFRDTFGVMWGLRVLDQVNRTLLPASSELTWFGFHHRDAAAVSKDLEVGLRNLLRRFVSAEWIDERLSVTSTSADRASDS